MAGFCIVALQVLLLIAIALQTSIPVERLFRDTIAVAEEYPGCCHVYDGMMSNLGILIWWSTASVTAFTFLLLTQSSRDTKAVYSFAAATVFTAWLALDDLFMLHESVFPLLGVSQYMTYLVYGGLVFGYLYFARSTILARFPLAALTAVGFLAASAGVDVLADGSFGPLTQYLKSNPRIELLLDDGSKFMGIGVWLILHLFASRDAIIQLEK